MNENNGIDTFLFEEQARSIHLMSGENVMGVDKGFKTLFSFMDSRAPSGHRDQNSLSEFLVFMKEQQNEILSSNLPHFIFIKPYSWVFYVHLLKNENLNLILGPMQEPQGTEKFQNLIRICYWLFQSNDTDAIPQPTTYTLSHESKLPASPDVSLVHIYYEQEFIHTPIEQGMLLKSKMLAGDIKAIQDYFDSSSNIPTEQVFDPIELAKGDPLRSSKNHFITLCAIACAIAIEGGTDDEYARTLADKFIRQVENIQSRAEIYKFIREIFLKFTYSIIEFSNPNYSTLVMNTIHYMNNHFFEKLTLNDVAKKIGKSPSYISDKVNKETGLSFNENLNQIRVRESKQLLIHTQKSIHAIAIAVGFDYQNHFAKVFKKIVGVTPFQYRNKRGLL
ncbi:helix-turn-helix transcriptional regulator [Paenibacillus aceris]|uniref:AraC-like DNA-binding protein n=1 Tax=Paenibacillus aceris TaxID=869555 RepID=A0ABS4I9E3_9BACL|nr:helix-turn-helix transcriptional regulator [Paenibacillus aceris]MBP1967562.1 AraC-like DNA-binding protein [Paenibacillus aceris]NHW37554.1 helix-turn-helix transcriptional regulator [Paenibacillus aceris]